MAFDQRQHPQSGGNPTTPKAQSTSVQPKGMLRIGPIMSARGSTPAQQIIARHERLARAIHLPVLRSNTLC